MPFLKFKPLFRKRWFKTVSRLKTVLAFLLMLVILTGCSKSGSYPSKQEVKTTDDNYRTYYEVFLSSFYDSNGDGKGDINGLTQKLDYLNDGHGNGLGVTGIWLMPIMPSPSYHKYDVTDYFNIDPQLGTMDDFKKLISECHARGIKLIIDYEINHSSDKNPWFVSAVQSIMKNPDKPGNNKYLNYYNFTRGGKPDGQYQQIGNTGWYYEDEFSPSMPDLNLDSANVKQEISKSIKFWLSTGIDGFRLDAVLSYYGGYNFCNNNKNISFLNWFADTCKAINPKTYIVGEAWTDSSAISQYYKSHVDSFFAFPLAGKTGIIAKTLESGDTGNNAQTFAQEECDWLKLLYSERTNAVDAPFLSNHDMDRSAGYFNHDLSKTKMAAGMYLTLSGNAFIYYGEEIGMTGDGKDENKREPMLWSNKDRSGMTNGPPNMDSISPLYPAADIQDNDKNSLLNYYRLAVRLRNENPEITRGTETYVPISGDTNIAAIQKEYKGSKLLVVYNTSTNSKTVSIPKNKFSYSKVIGSLTPDGIKIALHGDKLTLQPYSIAVLK